MTDGGAGVVRGGELMGTVTAKPVIDVRVWGFGGVDGRGTSVTFSTIEGFAGGGGDWWLEVVRQCDDWAVDGSERAEEEVIVDGLRREDEAESRMEQEA
jgi:hypothetical protein